MTQGNETEVSNFDEYQKSDSAMCMNNDYNRKIYEAGAASRQAEINLLEKEIIETQEFLNNQNCIKQAEVDELQKRIDLCEKLRDSQFEKLRTLTQAIEVARNDADEDFDLFLNYLSSILKGESNE